MQSGNAAIAEDKIGPMTVPGLWLKDVCSASTPDQRRARRERALQKVPPSDARFCLGG
jgi:hypothetical protein